nr:armadillo repeat-containing protein 3 [Desmodus rotundus]
MSAEYTSKVQILGHGGLKPLIRLLSSPDPGVKKNSIECIYNLVQDFQCRAPLQELNAVPSIPELLKSEYPVIQLLALKTLDVIANDKGSRAMLRDSQGMDHLIKILETKLSPSSSLVDTSARWFKRNAPCMTSGSLTYTWEHPPSTRQKLTFIASQNPHFPGGTRFTATVTSLDQLPTCTAVAILRLRLAAALQSAPLSAAAEADGISPLINLLSSKRDGAIANAATVLTNMATQGALRENIQSQDITHALISPLRSANTIVQSKAALTIAATACDVEARTELRNLGALEPLIELLCSKNDEVRRHASWAVMVCASDELMAAELCRFNSLPLRLSLSVLMPTFRYGAMFSSACRRVDENKQAVREQESLETEDALLTDTNQQVSCWIEQQLRSPWELVSTPNRCELQSSNLSVTTTRSPATRLLTSYQAELEEDIFGYKRFPRVLEKG